MEHAAARCPPVRGQLAFMRSGDVMPRAPWDRCARARTLQPDAMLDPRSFDLRECDIVDCADPATPAPNLLEHGFTHTELAEESDLQAIFARLRAATHVSERDARELRQRLMGRRLRLSDGRSMRVLFVASEGLIMRRAGPNGLQVGDSLMAHGANGHTAAVAVHADQDVEGTPVRQLLGGLAPRLFHHQSPGHANHRSRLFLINLWIPLRQLTRPLALMDQRSLNRERDQLRYGLPTDDFLRRDASRAVNDIWTFRHASQQRWYFTSDMDSRRAYVFETFATPHASFVLPGEAEVEACHRSLSRARRAVLEGDAEELARAVAVASCAPECSQAATWTLRRAVHEMGSLLRAARDPTQVLGGPTAAAWLERAHEALESVIRTSLELRAVAWLC